MLSLSTAQTSTVGGRNRVNQDRRGRVRVSAVYRFDEVGEPVGGFSAHTGEQVLVGVNRERRVGVAESF